MNDPFKKLQLDLYKQQAEIIKKMKPQINFAQAIKPQIEISTRMNEIFKEVYKPILENVEFQLKISELIKPINFSILSNTKILNVLLNSQRLYSTEMMNTIIASINIPKEELFNALRFLEYNAKTDISVDESVSDKSNIEKIKEMSKAFVVNASFFGEGAFSTLTGAIPGNIADQLVHNEPLYITTHTNIALVFVFFWYACKIVVDSSTQDR